MSKETNKLKIYYGWYVVIACFFVTMSLGETVWSFGVFFKPLQGEFGWSRRLVSSGYTAFLIGYSLSIILAGRIADRYGPRLILIVCGLLAGLGISMCSQVYSVKELRLFLLVAGIGAGATWSVPTSIVQRWFYGRHRAGLALSIVVSGVGIGALVFTPLINYWIQNHGWRNTFLIIGMLFSFLIVVSSLVIRKNPTEVQMSPDQGKSARAPANIPDLSTVKLVTNPSFLIIIFASCVTGFAFQLMSVHFVPYATDMGNTSTVAARAIGLMGAFSIPGRLLAGLLSDRVGWKKTIAISIFGLTLSTIWLLFSRFEWMLYIFALLFGLFWGNRTTSLVGTLGDFFGMRSLGELIGITSAASTMFGAFVPYIAGYIFDTMGSYFLVFITMALLLLSASLLITAVKKPQV